MFILVRRDLDSAYRMVQGMHALAGFMLKSFSKFGESFSKFGETRVWQNETLVCVIVDTEADIIRWSAKLRSRGIDHVAFNEPDLGQWTALACPTDDDKLFSGLRLAPVM